MFNVFFQFCNSYNLHRFIDKQIHLKLWLHWQIYATFSLTSHSANTKIHQCEHVKNKCNHIKAHSFY